MNIKFLKFTVIFMGILIVFGIIALCIGIYYKINNINFKEKAENKIILMLPKNYNLESYYINNDKIIVNYQYKKKKIIHIYDLENGSLKKTIELLK